MHRFSPPTQDRAKAVRKERLARPYTDVGARLVRSNRHSPDALRIRAGIAVDPESQYHCAEHFHEGPSHLLQETVRNRFKKAGLPMRFLQIKSLAAFARDFELHLLNFPDAWQQDLTMCNKCASYMEGLVRELAIGVRHMVPVACDVSIPVDISKIGHGAQTWPFEYDSSLGIIDTILANWKNSPDRQVQEVKRIFLKIASSLDDVLFWILGDVQWFGRIVFADAGLPVPHWPQSVWYQCFRACDGGARTLLYFEGAVKFAQRLLEFVRSFFSIAPKATPDSADADVAMAFTFGEKQMECTEARPTEAYSQSPEWNAPVEVPAPLRSVKDQKCPAPTLLTATNRSIDNTPHESGGEAAYQQEVAKGTNHYPVEEPPLPQEFCREQAPGNPLHAASKFQAHRQAHSKGAAMPLEASRSFSQAELAHAGFRQAYPFVRETRQDESEAQRDVQFARSMETIRAAGTLAESALPGSCRKIFDAELAGIQSFVAREEQTDRQALDDFTNKLQDLKAQFRACKSSVSSMAAHLDSAYAAIGVASRHLDDSSLDETLATVENSGLDDETFATVDADSSSAQFAHKDLELSLETLSLTSDTNEHQTQWFQVFTPTTNEVDGSLSVARANSLDFSIQWVYNLDVGDYSSIANSAVPDAHLHQDRCDGQA